MEVYLYHCLEEGFLWKSYYSQESTHVFKCGSSKCKARLKILVQAEEEKEDDGAHNEQSNFNLEDIKDDFELKVPQLIIHTSNSHSNHDSDYKQTIQNRLKGILIYTKY